MSYTGFGQTTGDNLIKIGEWRQLQQKIPSGDRLTSTIMMTSLSSAVAQAARQNSSQVQSNMARYSQEYPKLSAKAASNRAIADILRVFDEMHAHVQRTVGAHLSRTEDEQRKYNVGAAGAERNITGQPTSAASAADFEAQAQRAGQNISLSIPASPVEKSKTLLYVVAGIALLGGIVLFIKSRQA